MMLRMIVPALEHTVPRQDEARAVEAWWEAHYDELLQSFPEQFVAVRDGHVVASNPDLALLAYELRDLGLSPRDDVAIELITASRGNLLL